MDKERLEKLIYGFYNKQLNPDEKAEFEDLLKSSDEARKIFHRWNFVNQATDALFINKNIPELHISLSTSKISLHNIRWRLINAAAILTIPLIIALSYFLIAEKDAPIVYSEVTATNAKVVSVLLPDGSKVFLYSGSSLKYPDKFSGDKRLIKLEGEATFEVKSNPENPFFVETTDGTRVKAYGTKFSVRNYEYESKISVYLERGIVDFESAFLSQPVTMKPETKLLFDKESKKYTVHHTTPNEYDAYEQGILLFDNKPLEEVVRKLNTVYQANIIIEDESLKEYRFTAVFKDESIYQIMNMLTVSSPQMQWKKDGNKIILTKKKLKSKPLNSKPN